MTLKELSQLYYLNREIEQDKKRLEELKARSCSLPGLSFSGMPGGGSVSGSSIDRYVAEIVDLEAIISAKITQCLHERNRLERYIESIPDSLTRMVFTLRIINGLRWMQVAENIGGWNTEDSVKKICYRYIDKENEKERH
jgi:hypothetical protein